MDKARQILAADGVEESAVPIIELHLSEHVGSGDGGRGKEDRHHPSAALGPPQHTREQGQVAGKIEILRWHSFDEFVREKGSRYDRNYRNYRQYRLCRRWDPRRFLRRRVS